MGLLARTRSGDLELRGNGSLMAQALAAGLPVASSCSGRGACGRCMVAILEGEVALTAMDAHECEVLHRNGASPAVRLACQTRLLNPEAPVSITTGYW